MAKADTAVIRTGIGDYRIGDTIAGDDLKAFLKGNPDINSYHMVTLPDVDQRQKSLPTVADSK